MTLPLTKIEGAPDRADIRPGMAYFPGTGPADKTCGECAHLGYRRTPRTTYVDRDTGEVIPPERRQYTHKGCSKYRDMAGRHGSKVAAENPSCKYFAGTSGK